MDAFKGFTAQELQVLAVAMRQTSRLTIALCADTLQDTSGGYGRFSPALRTASRLMRLAQDGGVPVAKPLYLTENWRAENDALRWLEAGAFTPCPDVWEGDAEAVTVTPCADIYGECAWATRTIRRLLREGERCRDIALVARNFADYQGVLDVALEQEGVAYYMDARKDVLTDPLITLVLSAPDAGHRRMGDGGDTAPAENRPAPLLLPNRGGSGKLRLSVEDHRQPLEAGLGVEPGGALGEGNRGKPAPAGAH